MDQPKNDSSRSAPPSADSLDEEEALNIDLASKLKKLRGFRRILDLRSRALHALEEEKARLEEQVDDLNQLVLTRDAKIKDLDEQNANRVKYMEKELEQLKEDVKKQKTDGKDFKNLRKEYRLCQEHCEAFLTALVHFNRRRHTQNFDSKTLLGQEKSWDEAVHVEQQALLETFFVSQRSSNLKNFRDEAPFSVRSGQQRINTHKGTRLLWQSLRMVVEEVVKVLEQMRSAHAHGRRAVAQAEEERDKIVARAEENESRLLIALRELQETRSAVGALESVARTLRESMQELEGTRAALEEELRCRDAFLMSLTGKVQALEVVEVEGSTEEGGKGSLGAGRAEPGGTRSVPDFHSGDPKLSQPASESMDLESLQRIIYYHLDRLSERLLRLGEDSHGGSDRQEEELGRLRQTVLDLQARNVDMGREVESRAQESADARKSCERQSKDLHSQMEQVKILKRAARDSAQKICSLEEDLSVARRENERLGRVLAQTELDVERERLRHRERQEETAAWRRRALKLQEEVTDWQEKMSSEAWGGNHEETEWFSHGLSFVKSSNVRPLL